MTSSSTSPLNQAISLTTRTIERRSFHFRNTVIAIVVIVAATVVSALIIRSWRPLAGLFLLPSIVGAFILNDSIIVNSWRREIVAFWSQGIVDLAIFAQTIGMMKSIPKATINGMLALLPQKLDSVSAVQAALRSALAETDRAIAAVQIIRTITTFAVVLIMPASLGIAVFMFSLLPLFGATVLFPAFGISLTLEWITWRHWQKKVSTLLKSNSFGREDFLKATSLLTWGMRNETLKTGLLGSFGTGTS